MSKGPQETAGAKETLFAVDIACVRETDVKSIALSEQITPNLSEVLLGYNSATPKRGKSVEVFDKSFSSGSSIHAHTHIYIYIHITPSI